MLELRPSLTALTDTATPVVFNYTFTVSMDGSAEEIAAGFVLAVLFAVEFAVEFETTGSLG